MYKHKVRRKTKTNLSGISKTMLIGTAKQKEVIDTRGRCNR